MNREMRMRFDSTGSRIGLFLLLTLALSSVFWALVIIQGKLGGGLGTYVRGLMWCPGVAALLTCRIARIDIGVIGWRWGRTRWQVAAWLLPLLYAGVAYGIVWATGLGGFGSPEFFKRVAEGFGWTTAPNAAVLVFFLSTATLGVIGALPWALGEEIGWRGFLAPAMHRQFGFTRGALLTGVIWALWHAPILLFADYNSGTPWWFGFSCFLVLVVCDSVMMAWLRMRSGSVWTAAILHASHNALIQVFFTPATSPRGDITPYAIDEFGFMLALVALPLAFWFWHRRDRLPVDAGADPSLEPIR